MSERSYRRQEDALLVFGCCLYLAWIWLVPTQPVSDFAYYHSIGQEIASGLPWGTSYTPIGYSMLLALLYTVAGDALIVPKVLQVALSVGNACLFRVWLNTTPLAARERCLLLAAFVLFPGNVFYNSLLATEPLFTFLLLAVSVLYCRTTQTVSWRRDVAIGVISGLAVLVKQQFIVVPLLLGLHQWLQGCGWRQALRRGVLILAVSIVVTAPQMYYNSKMVGQFTTTANNGGIVLYINNNSENRSGRWMPAEEVADSLVLTPAYEAANMTARNHMLRQAALQWISHHPLEFIRLGGLRLLNTFGGGEDVTYALAGVVSTAEVAVGAALVFAAFKLLVFTPALLAAVWAAWRYCVYPAERDFSSGYVLFLLGAFSLLHFISEGQSRYSYPLTFMLIYYGGLLYYRRLTPRQDHGAVYGRAL